MHLIVKRGWDASSLLRRLITSGEEPNVQILSRADEGSLSPEIQRPEKTSMEDHQRKAKELGRRRISNKGSVL